MEGFASFEKSLTWIFLALRLVPGLLIGTLLGVVGAESTPPLSWAAFITLLIMELIEDKSTPSEASISSSAPFSHSFSSSTAAEPSEGIQIKSGILLKKSFF